MHLSVREVRVLREQSFNAQGKEIEMLKIEIQDLGCGFQVRNISKKVAIPNCFIVGLCSCLQHIKYGIN